MRSRLLAYGHRRRSWREAQKPAERSIRLLTSSAIPAWHLVSMWLAGFRAWFAGGAGIVSGVLLVLLLQAVL
ncbi:hypothetical protein AC628_36650 [Bradyrhizobium sp. NAS96.2]|nr:hypothetical protein AC628_36650 [Bradyrhizobium sp. NAS96.2]